MFKKNYSRRYAKDFTIARFMFQKVFIGLFLVFVIPFYRCKITGRQNVPKGKKYICSPNHISYLDPFLAAMALNKPIAYMAKKELFEESRFKGFLMGNLAAFAVNREKLEISTIKTAREVCKTKNWILGIFPQGGIKSNKKIESISKGFVAIAKSESIDILPVGICGCETYNWIPFKGKIRISIGTLISHKLEPEEIVSQWSRQIAELTGYEYEGTQELLTAQTS